MKKLGLLCIICLSLTACLYTDHEIVEERDIVVSKQKNRLELGNHCESIDATHKTIRAY